MLTFGLYTEKTSSFGSSMSTSYFTISKLSSEHTDDGADILVNKSSNNVMNYSENNQLRHQHGIINQRNILFEVRTQLFTNKFQNNMRSS